MSNYIQASLSGALDDIRNAPQSTGNKTLFAKGRRLFEAVAAGQFTEQEITIALEQAAQERNISPSEAKSTIDSARKAGLQNPVPLGNGEQVQIEPLSHNVANEFDDLDELAKQKKSLEGMSA